jgi:hypothetical protein
VESEKDENMKPHRNNLEVVEFTRATSSTKGQVKIKTRGDEIDLVVHGLAHAGTVYQLVAPSDLMENGFLLEIPAFFALMRRLPTKRKVFDKLAKRNDCYANAPRLLNSAKYYYLFGGLVGKLISEEHQLISVTAHAWCVDRAGVVAESTPGLEDYLYYFGFPVTKSCEVEHVYKEIFAVETEIFGEEWSRFESWSGKDFQ